ncbi:hypothetical protein VOLCADRAFT_91842 [Volvox carteri f. nagariensis]|uniref:Uncharacterized protein n=1 Tax=Volvox carteri f. nagariensis TaxID=3068 RepID=D8TY35_VOLCA|nr:uncharacterized protein VOLCADRAFT_91842 [Volvox carteri f. nagariensis]EFJ47481.1 hypothetical protein VOLCADRAFT_91842 [Volvox carteri f. nagariensis]|eukprot:XP_002951305.1 hypothetical protein VOLCADRAFT_91842 [Volvox carteri f. nagariensis]
MAARFEDDSPAFKECANCGATDDLLRCSRCRAEWFCSLGCHKSCRPNEFADAMEDSDPRFASWLRRHGKQAILRDVEVERLERAARATSGPGREDVMQAMYGRLDPKPQGRSSPPDSRFGHFGMFGGFGRCDVTLEANPRSDTRWPDLRLARLLSRQEAAWSSITIEPGMGMECARCGAAMAPRPRVQLKPTSVCVSLGLDDLPILCGHLYGTIKAEDSTWYLDDGILHLQMLKVHRRGHYAPGTSNADSWWRSLWAHCPPAETLSPQHPPTKYYWSEYENNDLPAPLPEVPRLATHSKRKPVPRQNMGDGSTATPDGPRLLPEPSSREGTAEATAGVIYLQIQTPDSDSRFGSRYI